ncbi:MULTISPECIES: conjugal transfer protein [unclassified Pseudomonas]|uniref:secretion/conjugation apparatus DotM-related subunit n=1 Tax=unclassified Pseudomonas TaxID=196821 RepID=UPI002AB53F2C|nr:MULTISPECIES: conjugal transfer protein [unclassified Pseudomonas]MDY7563401.1 conjugal transfer protein [Pseudomonas sp. AB6]MEA9979963.1 conjugal transfer protein [Pseudomonas sp. RTS4]MEB0198141.1 conjugal transfer protein [Pseudomonas sp. 5S4]MEB0213422.1 conjugal transfer protein [Pseudomonas sp. AB6]MEB0247870.1 conjugal transfer protein [Pseudomonas sp. 10S5]
MQNKPSQASWESEQAHLLLALCAVVLLCWLFFDSFVYWTSWMLYWLWMMVDFPFIHMWVGGKINLLASLANHAKDTTFSEWLDVMNQTSTILMLFLAPLVVFSSFSLAQHPMLPFRSKRLVNIHSLPGLVSAFAPSVIPVLAGSGGDGLMNDTSPENAWGLKPEEFAEQHNLIRRQVLNREAARVVFEAQIKGPPHDGLKGWAPYERALFAVFGAQVFLNDRKAALKLLDDLNRSCLVKGLLRRKQRDFLPIYSLADKIFARLEVASGVGEWLQVHGYVHTAMAGLYGRDLRLPSAKFRWLKGVDRTLWYALHSADTAKVFVEGSGVLAQARAESKAQNLGLPRPGLLVKKAIEGLQTELESIGLVFPREIAAARRRLIVIEPVMTAIYAVEAPLDNEGA